MKKEELFYNSSRIEIRLGHPVAEYYYLKYRFIDIDVKYKFLFFSWIKKHQKSAWRTVVKYHSPIRIDLSSIGNPDNDINWYSVIYRADDFEKLEHFKELKSKIKTYKDLDREFGLTKAKEQYLKDREEYNRIYLKSKELLKSCEDE
jgi:hypothetical protein